MDVINNYKVKDFLKKDIETIEEYIGILKYINPTKTKNKIFDMTLRNVQSIKDYLLEGTFEELIKCAIITEEKTEKEILSIGIVEFWGIIQGIVKQIEDINHMERVSLTSEHANFKAEAVNYSEKMSKFGIYNTIDRLANGDITKYETILDLPYADVFTKMYMDRVKSDLEKDMSNIKTKH